MITQVTVDTDMWLGHYLNASLRLLGRDFERVTRRLTYRLSGYFINHLNRLIIDSFKPFLGLFGHTISGVIQGNRILFFLP